MTPGGGDEQPPPLSGQPGQGSGADADGPSRGRRAPKRRPFLLRLPPELMDELRGWANQELRSLNAHIEYVLREALKRRRGGRTPPPEA